MKSFVNEKSLKMERLVENEKPSIVDVQIKKKWADCVDLWTWIQIGLSKTSFWAEIFRSRINWVWDSIFNKLSAMYERSRLSLRFDMLYA